MNLNRFILFFSAVATAGLLVGCGATECNNDADCDGYVCLQNEDAAEDAEFTGECSEDAADGCADGYTAEEGDCVKNED